MAGKNRNMTSSNRTPRKKELVKDSEDSYSSSEESVDLKMAENSSSEEESVEDSVSESDSDNEEDNVQGFTDENSGWLKPKKRKQLLDDSDDDSDGDENDEFGAASDDSDDEEEDMLEIERESKLLDKEMEIEQNEAKEEMRRTIADSSAVFHLPTV